MTRRAIIGIMSCNRWVGEEQAYAVMHRYVDAVLTYGDCAALIIPASDIAFDAGSLATVLDGLLLTGSPSNIAPERYGQSDGDGPFDPQRDQASFAMIEAMIGRQKPIFGICRGFQEINVALGGTLRRDLGQASDGSQGHHAPDGASLEGMFAHSHAVGLPPNGLLRGLLGTDTATVSSVHYQGIQTLAGGLEVEAVAPDGLVEAFSGDVGGAPIFAVQWHPEWNVDASPDGQAFFALLGRALKARRDRDIASPTQPMGPSL